MLMELERRWDSLIGSISEDYMENARRGLNHWVEAGNNDRLAWGILGFAKP
jgi:hypothetical protein